MSNFKYGFLRTAKTKNAKNFPWLKRFNNDFFSHTFHAKPIEWKKETIDDLLYMFETTPLNYIYFPEEHTLISKNDI